METYQIHAYIEWSLQFSCWDQMVLSDVHIYVYIKDNGTFVYRDSYLTSKIYLQISNMIVMPLLRIYFVNC